jgi:hypothetical protein
VSEEELRERQRLWVSVDAPWAQVADPVAFGATVDAIVAARADDGAQQPPPAPA